MKLNQISEASVYKVWSAVLKLLKKHDLLVPVCHLASNLKQNITDQVGLNSHLVFSSVLQRNYT